MAEKTVQIWILSERLETLSECRVSLGKLGSFFVGQLLPFNCDGRLLCLFGAPGQLKGHGHLLRQCISKLELLVIDYALFGHPNCKYSNKSIAENEWQPNQSPDAQLGEELSLDRRVVARVASWVVLDEGTFRLDRAPGWAGLCYSIRPLSERMSGFLGRHHPSALADRV